MDRWSPLFNKIVESSIWDEDDSVCKVWITLMAIQDADHVVRKTAYAIGRAARKTIEEVERALNVLAAPDTRRPGQEHDGRRIRATEDGWLILNGDYYEQMMRKISRQVYQAKWAREHRAKLRDGGNKPEVGWESLNKLVEDGTTLNEDIK